MTILSAIIALSFTFSLQTSSSARQIAKIAFTRGEYIFVKDMKTGVEKRLVKGSYPSLSPDATTLAYSTDNLIGATKDLSREIKLLELGTGKITGIPSLQKYLCYGAVWSNDGKMLAFSLLKDNHWEVAVINRDDHDWHIVTGKFSKSVGVSLNTWAPDNKSLLCQDLDKIYQVGLDGDVITTYAMSDVVDDVSYTSSATVFSLSPDGRTLLFDTDINPTTVAYRRSGFMICRVTNEQKSHRPDFWLTVLSGLVQMKLFLPANRLHVELSPVSTG